MPDKLPSPIFQLPSSSPELPASHSQLPSSNSHLPTPDFHLRSEEVQDILTKIPHWMIRWGSLVFLFILLLLFFISWMIKYPDIISTEVLITTQIPPEKIISRSSGKIEAILVPDKTVINAHSNIAIIENAASYQDVLLLKSVVDSIDIEKSVFPFEKFQKSQFGEVESSFALFQKEYIASDLNKKLLPFLVEKNAQNFESNQLKERLAILESQKDLNLAELTLLSKDLERHQKLFEKGVIASQELEKQNLNFLQAKKNYQNLLSSISQLKSNINDLNKNNLSTQINENTTNINLERSVLQSFFHLKKALRDWELNYVLKSTMDGTVSFLEVWAVNQTINTGDHVFSVVPNGKLVFLGKIKATAQNAGKIKKNQTVHIRLANYPEREFGMIKGIVKNISLIPDKDGNLHIDVALPNGIETSYNKKIVFQNEMSGTADIVTEDLRLTERLLYQFRDLFSRNKQLEKKEKS
jgi:multidrug efflux pump subunit AcrA (membrane-fusion protein)